MLKVGRGRVTRVRGAYYFRETPDVQMVRIGATYSEAKERLSRINSGEEKIARVPLRTASEGSLERHKGRLFAGLMARARRRHQECMTRPEFDALWKRAAGKCELTGIAFTMDRHAASGKRPWAPSVDRIDCGSGYASDNCRLVCAAVNVALNEFGDAVLRRIAQALFLRSGG